MKILITGSDGAIGREIASHLKKLKFNLILHTKKKNKKNSKYYFFCNDLSKKIELKDAPQIIIHCASANKNSYDLNAKINLRKNIDITKNIINYANSNNVKKIFFFSSVDAYGLTKKKVISENHTSKNLSSYGKAKLISEKLFCKNINKFKVICFRIPGVLTVFKNKQKPILLKIVDKMVNGKKVEVYNSNSLFNNVIDVHEISKIIRALIQKNIKKNDVYNLSATEPLKFLNIIKILKKKTKYKKNIIIRNNRDKSFTINNNKLTKQFDINISTTRKIVKRFLNKYLI